MRPALVLGAVVAVAVTVAIPGGHRPHAVERRVAVHCQPSATATPPPVGSWDAEQLANASIIVNAGSRRLVPPRGWVVAVATALADSSLRDLPDADGWADAFYARLDGVPGWASQPLAEVVGQVRAARGAEPAEGTATALVARALLTGIGCAPAGFGAWVAPIDGPIVSPFRPADRGTHDGIDILAPKGTPIHAATAGTVTKIRCNASLKGKPYPCDRDGSPDVRGCGWYLEITHPGKLVTRYCHQLVRPTVRVGQAVVTGQPIGVVGTSGHSSAPHLHFEVHSGSRAAPANAVDPLTFLLRTGVLIHVAAPI